MNFFEQVLDILKADERFFSEDGTLLRNAVYEAAMQMDKTLIKRLFEHEATKSRFFTEVDGVYIFDKIGFGWVINNREFLPDSFTRYKNKIGLTSGVNYISASNDVELVFPYKDCILEGGQTKEDQKRDEIFYNTTLAPDEVDRLLYPKIFTNAHRYSTCSTAAARSLAPTDNLLIKGNNLLALSSLLKRYEGMIDCIYIDPPYNTHSSANTFAYNNNFNHSSWLTFMKNRLEIAKRLLSEKGIIFIDIDHNELFYLGVLADEIFGQENRLGVLAVVHNLKARYSEFFSVAHENKLVYAKNVNTAIIKDYQSDNLDDYPYEDQGGRYKLVGLQRTGNGSRREDRPNLFYPIYYDSATGEISTEHREGFYEILPIDSEGVERRWRWSKAKLGKEWKTETEVRKVRGEYKIYTKIRHKQEHPKTLWMKPEYSGTSGTNELKNLIGSSEFSYPKSVALVKDSLEIATDPDSIVLDFFGGSGTTGQAVLELNQKDNGSRQFILVEQMDYIDTVTCTRLNAVINRLGHGSFVYCELAKLNQKYVDMIQDADDNNIASIWEEMQKTGFISSKINPKDIDPNADDFKALSLNDKKRLLMELLDLNQLYINYCDIDDETFGVSDVDKAFTKSFYEDK